MKVVVVISLAVLFGSVSAEEVPKEKVKAAYLLALKRWGVPPERVEKVENAWDGTLPDTVSEMMTILHKGGLTDEEAQAAVDALVNLAKNKDSPRWKSLYADVLYKVHGADRFLVDMFFQYAPDHVPRDIEEAKESLELGGVEGDEQEGCAKILVWLGNNHI